MVGSGAAVVHGCVLATTSVRRCQGAVSAVGMFFSVLDLFYFYFFLGKRDGVELFGWVLIEDRMGLGV